MNSGKNPSHLLPYLLPAHLEQCLSQSSHTINTRWALNECSTSGKLWFSNRYPMLGKGSPEFNLLCYLDTTVSPPYTPIDSHLTQGKRMKGNKKSGGRRQRSATEHHLCPWAHMLTRRSGSTRKTQQQLSLSFLYHSRQFQVFVSAL